MDQLKTYKLNFKQVKGFSITPVIVFYLKIDSILVFQLVEGDENVDIDFEFSVKTSDNLTDDIGNAIKQLNKQKKLAPRAKYSILVDDYYISMYRLSFSANQMKNFYQSIELEIDNLQDYYWEYTQGPKESRDITTILVFMMKKTQLNTIEAAFKNHKIFLRRIITRYHSFMELFQDQEFKIEPSKLNLLVDISSSRVRVFCALNNEIKMYRRMAIKPLHGTKKDSSFDVVFKTISTFIESSMDSYISRFSNQSFNSVYVYSDVIQIPKQLKKYSIMGAPVKPLEFLNDYFSKQKLSNPISFPFVYATFNQLKDIKSFNLIPIMKRFEKFMIITISVIFLIMLSYSLVFGVVDYFSLKKELAKYSLNLTDQLEDQQARKAEIILKRDRAKDQKKILDYAELTDRAFSSQIPIDDFLLNITSMASTDMTFDSVRVKLTKVHISGTSSSLNGNYTFYTFLQNLETIPYLSRPRYNLTLAGGVNKSKFSIQIDWKIK